MVRPLRGAAVVEEGDVFTSQPEGELLARVGTSRVASVGIQSGLALLGQRVTTMMSATVVLS
jgi:hypothetical protein